MRCSTGRFCVELTPHPSNTQFQTFIGSVFESTPENTISLNDANKESKIIASLELFQYHYLCYWYRNHTRKIPGQAVKFNLGAVICCHDSVEADLNESVEIASLTNLDFNSPGWQAITFDWDGFQTAAAVGKIMEDGWTRYFIFFRMIWSDHVEYCRCNSMDIFNTTIAVSIFRQNPEAWLCRANHIFSQLQVTSNYEDYGEPRIIPSLM